MIWALLELFTIVLFIGGLVWAISLFGEQEPKTGGAVLFVSILLLLGTLWLQTHTIIPTQHVGITRNSVTQELKGVYPSGIMSKPFFSSVYAYPASSNRQQCEVYTPAIKGSYGITVDICYYIDASKVDWVAEINATGALNVDDIMGVWRNSIVGDVAKSFKDYTPEQLNEQRFQVEEALKKNVVPWFENRNIPLVDVSFKNWDFTSEEVAKAFDESIVSQRKITEQSALLEAAKVSRQRELYEAETNLLVAQQNSQAFLELGLNTPKSKVDYLWIKMLGENNKLPSTIILQTGNEDVPVSVVP
jgi:hypothetical protein